jgi:hypothetical protein
VLSHLKGIDHVVLNVRDRMEEAIGRFRRLGFQLTPRGYHTLGSINHLMVFGPDYLEVLGYEIGKPPPRTTLVVDPIGPVACAVGSSDSRAIYQELHAKGVAVRAPMDFSRPVELDGGRKEDATFCVTGLEPGAVEGTRLTFCQHFTRHLVWRPEWQRHSNGTTRMLGAVAAVRDPVAAAAGYAKILGNDVIRVGAQEASVVLGHFTLELVTAAALRRRFGDFAPDGNGRDAYLAGLKLQTASMNEAKAIFQDNGIACRADGTSVLVPFFEAMGTMLEFVS